MAQEPYSVAEEGFSLVEVLCAFVIVSISATIVLQAVQQAARSSVAADERMQVLATVQKIELAVWTSGRDGSPQRGETDGFHWETHPIQSSASEGRSGISRLRIFRADHARHHDFLIEHRKEQP